MSEICFTIRGEISYLQAVMLCSMKFCNHSSTEVFLEG